MGTIKSKSESEYIISKTDLFTIANSKGMPIRGVNSTQIAAALSDLRLNDTSWDDLRFPVQGINPPGNVSDPDLESATGMQLFSSNSINTLAGVAQMPHKWKEGTTIQPHVHWQKTSSAAGNVLWRLDFEVVANGAVAAMDYGTSIDALTVATGTPDTNTANKCLISGFEPDIDMTDMKISTLILWKLSRIGDDASDTYGGNARLLEFDIHYEIDSFGSNEPFTK